MSPNCAADRPFCCGKKSQRRATSVQRNIRPCMGQGNARRPRKGHRLCVCADPERRGHIHRHMRRSSVARFRVGLLAKRALLRQRLRDRSRPPHGILCVRGTRRHTTAVCIRVDNPASGRVLTKLGVRYTHDETRPCVSRDQHVLQHRMALTRERFLSNVTP